MAKKMISLGEEYDSMCCGASSDSKAEKRINFPSIYYRGSEDIGKLPDGEFTIVAKVRRKEQGEGENERGEKTYNFTLEVRAIQIGGKGAEKDSNLPRAMRSAADMIAEEGSAMADEIEEEEED
jgi:hypothetical protein